MTREPTEMELRVAKALDFRAAALEPLGYPGDPERLLFMARAAIRAMREPTKFMVEIGGPETNDNYMPEGSAKDCWRAMIDAASPPWAK